MFDLKFFNNDFVPGVFIIVLLIGSIFFQYNNEIYSLLVLVLLILLLVSLLIIQFLKFTEYLFGLLILFLNIFILSSFPGAASFQKIIFPILAFVIIVFFVIKIDFNKILSKTFGKWNVDKILIFLLFFTLSYSIIVINTQDLLKRDGLFKIIIFVMGGGIFLKFIPKYLSCKYSDYYKMIVFLFIAGLGTAIIGLFGLFFQPFETQYDWTTVSYFRHPNSVAFLYTFSSMCGVYIYFNNKDKLSFLNRGLVLASTIIILVAQLFTYSRAGILATAAGTLILVFFYSKKLFLVIFLFTLGMFPFFFAKFFEAKGTASALSRFALIIAAVDLLNSSRQGLLWGFGTLTAFSRFHSNLVLFVPAETVEYPHNIFLFYILQFGIISLIPLALFIVFTLVKAFFQILKRNIKRNLLILPFAIIIAIIIESLLEDTLLFPEFFVYPLFLVFFGLLRINLTNNEP